MQKEIFLQKCVEKINTSCFPGMAEFLSLNNLKDTSFSKFFGYLGSDQEFLNELSLKAKSSGRTLLSYKETSSVGCLAYFAICSHVFIDLENFYKLVTAKIDIVLDVLSSFEVNVVFLHNDSREAKKLLAHLMVSKTKFMRTEAVFNYLDSLSMKTVEDYSRNCLVLPFDVTNDILIDPRIAPWFVRQDIFNSLVKELRVLSQSLNSGSYKVCLNDTNNIIALFDMDKKANILGNIVKTP